ncbi:hypothetical protein E5A73_05965 [Sphingomonas gei]|uniref:Uncharacterized protein n=1 Tax=Sphingomonas gei TaxID=1395960 RepID=A0A4S1XHN1_9SPHN|nr:hypothetical protein E5A73_05965 [Sphingomonas gei]
MAKAAASAKAEARAAESAAIRRRWITLGEVLAVIAAFISALTLWNSWSERSDSKADQQAEAQRASARVATLVLIATNSGDETLVLKPASAEQTVQSQRILLPASLGVAPVETTGESRIEAKWFERPLEKAREAAHLPDNSRGDERLPMVIITRFLADGEPHEDVALYDVGYTISGKFLSGHKVTLRGLSLISRVKTAAAQAKLDARWRTLLPPNKP